MTGGKTPTSPFVQSLMEWAKQQLAVRGWRVLTWEQRQADEDVTLFRLGTSGGDCWLKAVSAEYATEPSITRAISELIPDRCPRVLATDVKMRTMLLQHVHGPTLYEVTDKQAWIETAKQLAELQISTIEHRDELLQGGCADWTPTTVRRHLDGFFEGMEELMRRQESLHSPRLSRTELQQLAFQADHLCQELTKLELPETLVHGNFSPHNVIWNENRPVFLDWAFGIVGVPFIIEDYFRNRMEREYPAYSLWSAELQSAYYAPWNSVLSVGQLSQARALCVAFAPLVAAVHLFYQSTAIGHFPPVRAAVLRSLVRRFASEWQRLTPAMEVCV